MYHIGILTNVKPYVVCHSANSRDNGKIDTFDSQADLADVWVYCGTLKNSSTISSSLLETKGEQGNAEGETKGETSKCSQRGDQRGAADEESQTGKNLGSALDKVIAELEEIKADYQ